MPGLNNFLSDTQQTSTTMPAWYDQAQQNVVSQGAQALTNAPTLGQTTAQGAINTLSGNANPFNQAQGTLNQISSGAANPWITDPTTGEVTPDTSTAMGGLFKAQQQELNQLMPNYTAPAQAGAIGSGNFGSLRGQTAVNKAKGDAFTKLNAQQLQAALTNQQTGASAAANLGDVGAKGINAAMNVGQTQMNAPFNNLANYTNLIGSMQTPTTTQSQVQYSPLSQIGAVTNALSGSGAAGGLSNLLFGSAASGTPGTAGYKAAGKGLFGEGGLSSLIAGKGTDLWKYIQGIGAESTGTFPLEGGGELTINEDGSQYIKDANGVGTYYDAKGNPMTSGINSGDAAEEIEGSNPTNPDGSIDYSGGNWGTGDGYVDTNVDTDVEP